MQKDMQRGKKFEQPHELTQGSKMQTLIHYSTGHIDGTFVQFLHCHLSFVRFAAQEVGFQKNITCFGRKVLRKVQIADGFIRRQALILLVGRSRLPALYV